LPLRGWENPYVSYNPNFLRLLMSTRGRHALIKFMADKDWSMGRAVNWLFEEKLADLGYLERQLTREEKKERERQQARERDIELALKNWPTMRPESQTWFLNRYPEIRDLVTVEAEPAKKIRDAMPVKHDDRG
jgi:hypothetical protein